MLKRFALMIAATAVLAVPTSAAFAAPADPKVDGVLPEEACLAAIPAHAQPVLCGRGTGGPDGQY